jgi:CHAT domain-containing protein
MPKLVAGSAAALAIVLAVAGSRCANEPPAPARDRRLTDGRVVGEAYAPRKVMRGSPDFGAEIDQEIRESQIRNAAESGDARALSDLAAVVLTEATRSNESPMEAASLAIRAIEDDPSLAPAHFNLALALERIGLRQAARAEFLRAAELDGTSGWTQEARQRARQLLGDDVDISLHTNAYIAFTWDPVARKILEPYLPGSARNGGRSRPPADANARLRRAAYIYEQGMDALTWRVSRAVQPLCGDADPCAVRYSMAGALYSTGRASEARSWLASVDGDVFHTTGRAGLAAQLEWEGGLALVASGTRSADALPLFEEEHERSVAAGQPRLAAMFGTMADAVRMHRVKYALAAGDVAAAFRLADRGSSVATVQDALASDAAILRYATMDSGMVVFVVRRRSVDVVRLSADVKKIGSAAETLRYAEDAQLPAAASELHDLVFAPLLQHLDEIATIAVVPNTELAGLPFGALFDTNRGEYLAQRYTIVHAQSATVAVEHSRRANEVRDPTLLAIGATAFHHADALPGVNREIADIATASTCARVLEAAQATPEAVQRALAENAIIHYAGHIVRRGVSVRLLLAPSERRDGLSSTEIAAFRLQKPRVIVLAACRGAPSPATQAVVPTMAEAFLIAGVPTVIASAYDVDDRQAPATMRRLHEFLRAGDDAAEALRETTLAELERGRGIPLSIRFHAIGGTRSLIQ